MDRKKAIIEFLLNFQFSEAAYLEISYSVISDMWNTARCSGRRNVSKENTEDFFFNLRTPKYFFRLVFSFFWSIVASSIINNHLFRTPDNGQRGNRISRNLRRRKEKAFLIKSLLLTWLLNWFFLANFSTYSLRFLKKIFGRVRVVLQVENFRD